MSRKRWIKRVLAGFLAIGAASNSGCKQQLFMEPSDYTDAFRTGVPKELELHPHDAISPSVVTPIGKGPPTVLDTNRPPRYITLKECIAIALEQGNTGIIGSPANFGIRNSLAVQFTGRGVSGGSDAVRVFAIDPALAAAEMERSVSKFDARWISSMSWQKVDQPTAAQFLSFQNSRDAANLSTSLVKPLPTGGVAGITFSTDYSKFDTQAAQGSGFVNPNYTPRLQFTIEQPLLRLFGVEANQLSPSHPGSQLLNLQPSGGTGTEGILISRIRIDQSKANFEAQINYQMVNIEVAYWNLFAAYYNLYAQEEGLRQAFEGYQFIKIRVQTGNDRPQNVYQAQAQFERFRTQVLQARGQVLEAERNLRGLLNLRSDDGTRLVPIDKPNESPYVPDFYEAANEALANRPELLMIRQDLKAQQLNLILQKNLRQADLRSFAQYDIAGLGTRLDGPEFANTARTVPGNALTSLANNNFNSWTIGLRLDMPLGFRDANALVREAQLNVARSWYSLRDTEMKALEDLVLQYRQVILTHSVIGPKRAEREALEIYLGKIAEVIEIGNWQPADYQQYLTVQQQFAAALAEEYQFIANYNAALASFEFAKGTIQRYNNVTVGEGPLPPWVQKKAADHIRERTEAAIKLRERDVQPPPGGPGVIGGRPIGPPVGTPFITDLPPFAEERPPVPETLPKPTVEPKDKKDQKAPPGPGGPGGPAGSGGNSSSYPKLPRLPQPGPATTTPAPTTTTPTAPDANSTRTPGNYFQPSGTVVLPPHITVDRSPAEPVTIEPPPPIVPPGVNGSVNLPPLPGPAGKGTEPSSPSRDVEFGPTNRLPPIPTPGGSRE